MDELDQDLAALAPKVDAAAARRSFDTIRAGRRRRRHIATGAIGALAVVGLVGGFATIVGDDDPQQVDVGTEQERDDFTYEVLDEIEPPEGLPRLSLIVDPDQLAALSTSQAASDVDFDQDVVIVATLSVDTCAPVLNIMGMDDAIGFVVVQNPAASCAPMDPVARTFLIAADRAVSATVVRQSEDETLGLPEASLTLPSDIEFEVLAMEEATEPIGSVRVATDDAGFDDLWSEVGLTAAEPEVDLDLSIVVSMTIPDDACPPVLAGFDRGHEGRHTVLTPVFVEPLGGCREPLIPKTFVVAVERTAVDSREQGGCCLTVRLPAAEPFHGEVEVTVEVSIDEEDDLGPNGSATPTADGGDITFEVLALAEVTDPTVLRAATTEEAFRDLWSSAVPSGDMPIVDLAEHVVVSITLPEDECSPRLERFDRDGDTITPVFVDQASQCTTRLIPKTHIVALDRASLGSRFVLRLAADDSWDLPEQLLEVPTDAGELADDVVVVANVEASPLASGLQVVDDQSSLDQLGQELGVPVSGIDIDQVVVLTSTAVRCPSSGEGIRVHDDLVVVLTGTPLGFCDIGFTPASTLVLSVPRSELPSSFTLVDVELLRSPDERRIEVDLTG